MDWTSERFSLFGLVNADLRDIAQCLDGCHFEVIIAARHRSPIWLLRYSSVLFAKIVIAIFGSFHP